MRGQLRSGDSGRAACSADTRAVVLSDEFRRRKIDLKEILEKHKKWLRGDDGGERADLSRADLYGANLSGAKNVNDVIWSLYTVFYPLQCPEFGAYTAYKKAQGLIVELEIPADAKRSSATSRKCRASKTRIISITDINGNPAGEQVASDHDADFLYIVGETVEVANFEENRWIECAPGIHHYITRAEAVKHN